MLISKAEMGALRVVGMYKDAPAKIAERYMLTELSDYGYLKFNRARTCLRLTEAGAEILLRAGIKAEVEVRSAGYMRVLVRRMQNAEAALFFNSIGIDVFLDNVPKEVSESVYLSSSALRRQKYANVLGMSKFMGLLYTGAETFAVYNTADMAEKLYPQTDEDVFTREIISANAPAKILYVSDESLNTMAESVSVSAQADMAKTAESVPHGCTFAQAIWRFGVPVSLVSMCDGENQLRIMLTENHRDRIARHMLTGGYSQVNADFVDAKFKNGYLIVFIDFDVKRLEQALRIVKDLHIIVLDEQLAALDVLLAERKVEVYSIEAKRLFDILGIPALENANLEQYKTKEGVGVIAKMDSKNRKRGNK
jgi:hypothetical protein